MKKTFSLMLGACALALTTFTSCHDHDDVFDESAEMNSGTALTVEAQVEDLISTRASGFSWEEGDTIGISSRNFISNVPYCTPSGNGCFYSVGSGIYFKDRETHTFGAYYPYTSHVNDSIINIAVCDSANTAAQKHNDYLTATATASISSNSLKFSFKHAMVRLVITVMTSATDGFDEDEIFSDSCCFALTSIFSAATLNLNSGDIALSGNRSKFYLVAPTDDYENHSRQYVVYIPAQTTCSFELIFNRGKANQQVYKAATSDLSWNSGRSYNYTITAKRTGITLASETSISGWSNTSQSMTASLQ
jgi:hypothetical protein